MNEQVVPPESSPFNRLMGWVGRTTCHDIFFEPTWGTHAEVKDVGTIASLKPDTHVNDGTKVLRVLWVAGVDIILGNKKAL